MDKSPSSGYVLGKPIALSTGSKVIHWIALSMFRTTEPRVIPSSPGPLFQNEGRCSALDMEIIFHSHANKTHFHNKGCAPSLILKVRVFGTGKWPIVCVKALHNY